VVHSALRDKSKIYLPPLHIKLALTKISVKVMRKESKEFPYLRHKFPKISEANIKKGIVIDPQIPQLCKDEDFSTTSNSTERKAWKVYENVCRNFLGNKKAENYSEIVQELILSYSVVGHNMSFKLHFLHSHFDLLPENVGAISGKHDKKFQQDISQIGKWYSGK
jgi:hypothetical protein